MRENTLAAIDVGSSKICTLVAETHAGGRPAHPGRRRHARAGRQEGDGGQHPAGHRGHRHLRRARRERSSGSRIVSAHVSIGGNHAQSLNNRGIATIPGKQRPITEEDIDRALEGAGNLNLPTNREVLHSIAALLRRRRAGAGDATRWACTASGWTWTATSSPARVTAIQNLTQCVEGAGVQVEALVFSPLAAAEAVLEDEEKEQGVILADIGGGTTDIAVFVDGSVFHTTVLPVGGYHLTHDLVAGLRAPFSPVEELKTGVRLLPAQPRRRRGDRGDRGVRRPAHKGGLRAAASPRSCRRASRRSSR